MHPRQMLRELERAMPKRAMVSTDIGNICSVSNSYLRFEEPRSMLAAMSFGNCGYAFPVACGAKVAAPDRPAPLGLGGFASRQLVTAASVHLAAKSVAGKALKAASSILEVAEDQLELSEGHVRVKGGNRSIGPGEIARMLRGAPGYAFPAGVEPGLEASVQWRTDALAYANACHVVEVEVDPELGHVALKRYVALNDSGRMINPMIVEGQIHGGIVHGIGNALYELMGYDEAGQPVTTTFQEYLLVTATELPKLETIYRETPSPKNPIGAKGVGETGTIPAAAAVISAVENALSPFGIRISQTPVTPETLFNLIEAARRSRTRSPA